MSDKRNARGKAIRDAGFGKAGLAKWDALNKVSPTHARAIHEYVFGTLWDRPQLDLKFRELITIVAVATMNVQSEVQAHVRGALNRGATKEEITEIILHLAPYIGFPKTNHAFASAQIVFDEWEEKSKDEWKPL